MSNRQATKKTHRRKHLIFDDREAYAREGAARNLDTNAIIGGGYRK
jgi:hypothetical protein